MLELLVCVKVLFDVDGLVYDLGIKVGVMIEILVVVLILLVFLCCMDFFLIGMNDLI